MASSHRIKARLRECPWAYQGGEGSAHAVELAHSRGANGAPLAQAHVGVVQLAEGAVLGPARLAQLQQPSAHHQLRVLR